MNRTQGVGSLKAPAVAVSGGTIDVTVGPNDTSVEIGAVGHGKPVSHPVIPDKTNTLPVPPLPPGTVLSVRTGKGLRMHVVYVEIIALDP